MGELLKTPKIELIEPVVTPTIHADGVGCATRIGEKVHMVLYADHIGVDGKPQHCVVARIIMKIDPLRNNSFMISEAVLREMNEEESRTETPKHLM